MFVNALEVMLSSEELDAVVVLALHQVPGIPDPVELAKRLAEIASKYSKPVLAVDTGWSETAILERKEFEKRGVPAYPTPERAVRALGALYRYAQYLLRTGAYESYLTSFMEFKAKFLQKGEKKRKTKIASICSTPRRTQ
jgi:Acyl-CoA synthetase (NDP forming)